MKAHPPAVVVNVHAAVQPRGVTRGCGGQVAASHIIVRLKRRSYATGQQPHRALQDRAVEHVEHMCAPTMVGSFAVVREGHHTQNRLGLHDDVVIEQQRVIRPLLTASNIPREKRRNRQVALVDDAELTGEKLRPLRSPRGPCACRFAPGPNQEPCTTSKISGLARKSTDVVDAVLTLFMVVICWSRLTGLRLRGAQCRPASSPQSAQVSGASQVEPVPAAVTERLPGQEVKVSVSSPESSFASTR